MTIEAILPGQITCRVSSIPSKRWEAAILESLPLTCCHALVICLDLASSRAIAQEASRRAAVTFAEDKPDKWNLFASAGGGFLPPNTPYGTVSVGGGGHVARWFDIEGLAIWEIPQAGGDGRAGLSLLVEPRLVLAGLHAVDVWVGIDQGAEMLDAPTGLRWLFVLGGAAGAGLRLSRQLSLELSVRALFPPFAPWIDPRRSDVGTIGEPGLYMGAISLVYFGGP